jgi:hypothetical protein
MQEKCLARNFDFARNLSGMAKIDSPANQLPAL